MSGKQHGELNEISPAANAANANSNALTSPPDVETEVLTAGVDGRIRPRVLSGAARPTRRVRSWALPRNACVVADPHPGVGPGQPRGVPQVGVCGAGFDDRCAVWQANRSPGLAAVGA